MRTTERGMTLLEVVLAVLVLALGLIAGAALQVRALQATDGARRDSQAVHLAQGMLERARAAGGLDASEVLQWQAQVKAALGERAVGQVAGADPRLVVNVQWPDARDAAHPGIRLEGRP